MVLEIWYVCFDFMEKIAKQIEFALSCTYSVFTYFNMNVTELDSYHFGEKNSYQVVGPFQQDLKNF